MTPIDSATGVLGIPWCKSQLPWDPYLLWHDFAGSFNLPDDANLKLVTVIVQVKDRTAFDASRRQCASPEARDQGAEGTTVPTHPEWAALLGAHAEPFMSLMFDNPGLVALLKQANDGKPTGLRRLELSSSRSFRRIGESTLKCRVTETIALREADKNFRHADCKDPFHKLLLRPFVPKVQAASKAAAALPRKVAIGVIEDRPNYAAWPQGHVASLWVQSEPRLHPITGSTEAPGRHFTEADLGTPAPDLPVTYGRYRDFGTGGRALAGQHGGRCPDEHDEYRQARFMTSRPHQWSHGGAVLSVILAREPGPRGLHLVQLPGATVGDTAGGSLGGYALDGILHAAERARAGGCTHVIVNLSFGTHAGPHDGTSTFECAVRQILDHYDGSHGQPELHVVVPVGNTHLQRVHASACLNARVRCHRLQLRVLPDNPYPVFVELWLSERLAEVTIKLTSPTGVCHTVKRGGVSQWIRRSPGLTELCAAQIFAEGVSQGDTGTMALIAVGPTQPWAYSRNAAKDSQLRRDVHCRDLGQAPHGVWEIEVALVEGSQQAVRLDAWIQRADFAPGRSLDLDGFEGRQSYFVEEERSDIAPEVTLSGVASLQHCRYHVVGAMRQSDLGLAAYSAAGPARPPSTRFSGPDAVMQVDRSISLPGMLVGGVLSSSRVRIGGTSMAAAAYTRALHDWIIELPPRASTGLRDLAGGVTCLHVDTIVTPADPAPALSALRGDGQRMPLAVEGLERRFCGTCDPPCT